MSNLKERNKKVTKRVLENSAEIKSMRENFKKHQGLDPLDTEKLPVMKEGFSWKKLREKLSLREADTSSSFQQFLRAGIQSITNAMYEATDVTYEDWAHVISSDKDTELYAPNHGVSFPRQVGPSEVYPEVGAAALSVQLKNYKYGAVYALEKELLDDDQTGSFQRQAGMLGEYCRILAEVLCYGKLASVNNMQYIQYKIPKSETSPAVPATEANYPWSTSLVGSGANRPSSYGILNQANLQNGFIGLMNQKNLQGIKMMVRPNRLVHGPAYNFDSALLLNSSFYPSGAATAGGVGGAFSINPLKGLAEITVSRFVFKNDGTVTGDSKAWYLMDDSKPWFVMQMREACTVEQEAVNSGDSFNMDVYRFKARSRMNADFIDPRFAWQGDDGSVTS